MKPLRSLAVLLLLYRHKSEGLPRRSPRPGSVHAELQEWIAKAVAAGKPVWLGTRVGSRASEHGRMTMVNTHADLIDKSELAILSARSPNSAEEMVWRWIFTGSSDGERSATLVQGVRRALASLFSDNGRSAVFLKSFCWTSTAQS